VAAAFQPRKSDEDDEEEVELRMLWPLDIGNHGGGGVLEVGAGAVDPFNAVGTLLNLWQRMQLR
jgi:hypothetical protein